MEATQLFLGAPPKRPRHGIRNGKETEEPRVVVLVKKFQIRLFRRNAHVVTWVTILLILLILLFHAVLRLHVILHLLLIRFYVCVVAHSSTINVQVEFTFKLQLEILKMDPVNE